jgi:hypothetical protein
MNEEQMIDMIENQMDFIYERCRELDEKTAFALYQEYSEWIHVQEYGDGNGEYVLMTMPCWIN